MDTGLDSDGDGSLRVCARRGTAQKRDRLATAVLGTRKEMQDGVRSEGKEKKKKRRGRAGGNGQVENYIVGREEFHGALDG